MHLKARCMYPQQEVKVIIRCYVNFIKNNVFINFATTNLNVVHVHEWPLDIEGMRGSRKFFQGGVQPWRITVEVHKYEK